MHTKSYKDISERRQVTRRQGDDGFGLFVITVLSVFVLWLIYAAIYLGVIGFVLYMAWLVVQHIIGA